MISFTAIFAGIALVESEANAIIGATTVFVQEAEVAGATGAQKLAAVKDAVEAYLKAEYPALVSQFDNIWGVLTGVVNGVVALYNALGLFVKAGTAAVAAQGAGVKAAGSAAG